jgi:hypothetical protein
MGRGDVARVCGSRVALDQPIDGTRLVVKRSASGVERLLFVSRDPRVPFPAVGSADDPATGTSIGMIVALFSGAHSRCPTFLAPAGAGMPR